MMGNWGRKERGYGNHSSRGVWRQRSSANRPPPHDGYRSVPPWERKFCESVGQVPWRRLLDVKKFMYLFKDILNWNDAAGKEAFKNAKSRYWAEINGLPCNTALPDPDIYIDKVDWDVKIDPELILDLERPPEIHSQAEHDPVILGMPRSKEDQQFACGIGWENIDYEAEAAKEWENYVCEADGSKGRDNIVCEADGSKGWDDNVYEADGSKGWDNIVYEADGSKGWDNWNDGDNVVGGWSEPWQGNGYNEQMRENKWEWEHNEQKRENKWERERSTGHGRGHWSSRKKVGGRGNGNSSAVNRGGYGWNGGCKGGGRGRRVEAGGCEQQRWTERRGYCGRW